MGIDPLNYLPDQDKWQTFESGMPKTWTYMGIVSLETQIFVMGGKVDGVVATENQTYQAIYSILLPPTRYCSTREIFPLQRPEIVRIPISKVFSASTLTTNSLPEFSDSKTNRES